jgi:2-methylcitrate dehydratase
VTKVHIRTLSRAADILADASKYDPHSKETADHSLPYVIAAAIVDRQVTPQQFTADKISNPAIRAQLKKVEVVADAEVEKDFPRLQRVIVTVHTKDGRKLESRLDFPKGDPRNPLTDREVEEKFDALAVPVLSPAARERLKDAVWKLDELASVGELMKITKAG